MPQAACEEGFVILVPLYLMLRTLIFSTRSPTNTVCLAELSSLAFMTLLIFGHSWRLNSYQYYSHKYHGGIRGVLCESWPPVVYHPNNVILIVFLNNLFLLKNIFIVYSYNIVILYSRWEGFYWWINFFSQSSSSFKVLPAMILLAASTTCLDTTSHASFLFFIRKSRNWWFTSSSTCSFVIPSILKPFNEVWTKFKINFKLPNIYILDTQFVLISTSSDLKLEIRQLRINKGRAA